MAKKWTLDQLLISSFDYEQLEIVKENAPLLPLGVLIEYADFDAISMAKKLGALSINYPLQMASGDRINEAHKNGFKVFVYTVNSHEDIASMKSISVDGIFTNFPDRARVRV